MRWVRRNEDKPHRCPECHAIPSRTRRAYGPRTAVSCVPCRVKWRMGERATDSYSRYLYRQMQNPVWRYCNHKPLRAYLTAPKTAALSRRENTL